MNLTARLMKTEEGHALCLIDLESRKHVQICTSNEEEPPLILGLLSDRDEDLPFAEARQMNTPVEFDEFLSDALRFLRGERC